MENSDLLGFLKGLPIFAWAIIGVLAIGVLFAVAKKMLKSALLLAAAGAVVYLVGRYLI
ncbi:hypothetical protein MASR2M18_17800 [Ignavibacteria bacterium]|jgi:hypothetical protein|nr:hypothetical protein [Bacteroidota bacterium]MCZ2133632.1 hypothetical protein [Bacteroidota bacterium]